MKCMLLMLFCAALFACAHGHAGETMPLWPQGLPDGVNPEGKRLPNLEVFLPAAGQGNGAAIVVCPGGGYAHLASDYEGQEVAQWFAERGVAGIVLYYRHSPDFQHPAPLQDAQRAIRTVRARAKDWGIDPARIGILGFSAGGHLSATAGTLFEPGQPEASDPIERVSSRPDFMVLVYPVISMVETFGHAGSRKNLLGNNPAADLVRRMSPEKNVSANTPPAFLVASWEDTAVPAENSLAFFRALQAAGVPAELHTYEKGPHGFGMGKGDPVLSGWPPQCMAWLKVRGIVK